MRLPREPSKSPDQTAGSHAAERPLINPGPDFQLTAADRASASCPRGAGFAPLTTPRPRCAPASNPGVARLGPVSVDGGTRISRTSMEHLPCCACCGDLRNDFDVLFAVQDVVNDLVEADFLEAKTDTFRV